MTEEILFRTVSDLRDYIGKNHLEKICDRDDLIRIYQTARGQYIVNHSMREMDRDSIRRERENMFKYQTNAVIDYLRRKGVKELIYEQEP